jgi:malate dehydrogenase (oxaloacetate-decarboxylating)
LINALRVTGRRARDVRVVVNGVGAAGVATITMLGEIGIADIIAVDRHGILHRDYDPGQPHWREVAAATNADGRRGDLAVAMAGADVFIGLSRARLVSPDMVRSMAHDPIVFALANPEPEIMPDSALAAGAAVVASGRFDFPNHCNNVLAFPALMRGALDTKTRRITPTMCAAAAHTIAGAVSADAMGPTNILPSPLSADLYPTVAESVARAAIAEGLARISPAVGATAANTRRLCGLVAERQKNLAQICASGRDPNSARSKLEDASETDIARSPA